MHDISLNNFVTDRFFVAFWKIHERILYIFPTITVVFCLKTCVSISQNTRFRNVSGFNRDVKLVIYRR